jgi:hypothetical protein
MFLLYPEHGMAVNRMDTPTRADSVYYFKGRVVDSATGQPVAFSHIINTGRNTATICDTLGYFYLRVRLFDTLYLTALGYAPLQLVISDSLEKLEILPDIPMKVVSYSIRGVMINPLGSYSSFRHKVANLELPPTNYEINPAVLFEIDEGTDTLDMVPVPVLSPVTALYNWLSREGRNRRRFERLLEHEQFEKDVAYKYSPLVVSGITGYTGFELHRFMDFCSFKKKFLLESDQYEIRYAILEKQLEFEKMDQNTDRKRK